MTIISQPNNNTISNDTTPTPLQSIKDSNLVHLRPRSPTDPFKIHSKMVKSKPSYRPRVTARKTHTALEADLKKKAPGSIKEASGGQEPPGGQDVMEVGVEYEFDGSHDLEFEIKVSDDSFPCIPWQR